MPDFFETLNPEPTGRLYTDPRHPEFQQLAQRLAICQRATLAYVRREGLPIGRRGDRWVISNADGSVTPLSRHEVAALVSASVAFLKPDTSEGRDVRIDAPSNLVGPLHAHPPQALPELASAPGGGLAEAWVGFLGGWWSAWQSRRVSVANLVERPGVADLAPFVTDDDRGKRIQLGKLLGAREGAEFEIAPEPDADPLVVSPLIVGQQRSGAGLYILDKRSEAA